MGKCLTKTTKKADDNCANTEEPTVENKMFYIDLDSTDITDSNTDSTQVVDTWNRADVLVSPSEIKNAQMYEAGNSLDDNAESNTMHSGTGSGHVSVGMHRRCHTWDTTSGYTIRTNKKFRNLGKMMTTRKRLDVESGSDQIRL